MTGPMCIDGRVHKFAAHYPPPGQFGHRVIICEKCGRTTAEVYATTGGES